MDHICQSFQRNKASGSALRHIVAPLFRQSELALIVFLGVFCGSIAGALLFAPRHQPERIGFAAPNAISDVSEGPAQRYSTKVGVKSTHAIDSERDTARALDAAQKQFLQQQLSQSEAALLLARAKTSAVLGRGAALKELASQDSELQVIHVTKRDNATLLAELENTLLSLQLKHREMLTKYAPTYPLVHEVEAQIADAQNAILDARQSPIQEVTTAKTPRQDWIATELAKAQADRSEFEAESAADYHLIKHYEESLRRLDHTLAFEHESNQDAKRPDEAFVPVGSRGNTAALTALDSGSRMNRIVAENPAVAGATSALQWWPVSAFLMAALASILAAYLTDCFYTRFRDSA
jgi:hypothetical protein